MFLNKTEKQEFSAVEENKSKPIPTYLQENYPYKSVGDPIVDLNALKQSGTLYEIKCPKCEMSIRSQGAGIKSIYERMINGVEVCDDDGTTKIEGGNGCIGCGNKELIIREVDMSKISETKLAGIDNQKTENN